MSSEHSLTYPGWL